MSDSPITAEAHRRRTFAVIAHPDAGKSTLTEALALHARVISEAGAVHGKAGRKSTVSDWMDMEKDRGISVASSALQFEYAPEGHTGEPYMINLVDTPGHADFSEDTYRVLTAVDAAVMLVDGAKGLEPQTLKLFRVCKARGLPIITVVNKWDRPGKEPLELVDEIVTEIGLQPTPLFWPVGEAGDFRGLARLDDGEVAEYIHFLRTAGGSTIAPEEHYPPDEASDKEAEAWDTAAEEAELLAADGAVHDQELFLECTTSPMIFASAMLNFGVHQILDTLCALAPHPEARESDPKAVAAAAS
ncbi:MAG: GTP-binding protein, partial [Candidatus Corynebacterium faecigallinarum]